MLEFTKVFTKGQFVDIRDIKTIMRCKNIDYGHVCWWHMCVDFYSNMYCVSHVVDNIIDINVCDSNNRNRYTYFVEILRHTSSSHIVHYMLNNCYINEKSFNDYLRYHSCEDRNYFCECCPHKQFDKLTSYLTKVSLNRFKGYYNIEKYHDMMYIMLLIMKAQQKVPYVRSTLPSAIIKHLIIPFIYQ